METISIKIFDRCEASGKLAATATKKENSGGGDGDDGGDGSDGDGDDDSSERVEKRSAEVRWKDLPCTCKGGK